MYSGTPLFRTPLGQLKVSWSKEVSSFQGLFCTLFYVTGTMHGVLIKGPEMSSFQGCPCREVPLYIQCHVKTFSIIIKRLLNFIVIYYRSSVWLSVGPIFEVYENDCIRYIATLNDNKEGFFVPEVAMETEAKKKQWHNTTSEIIVLPNYNLNKLVPCKSSHIWELISSGKYI